MEVVVKADFSDALAGLDAMGRATSPHRELKELVIEDQRDHAKRREGPDGAWKPRALPTIRKMRLQGIRRRPLGKLLGAGVSYRANRAGVVGESKVAWSGVHQDGGRVGRGATVPARPFLWLSQKLLEVGERLLVNVKLRAFGGR